MYDKSSFWLTPPANQKNTVLRVEHLPIKRFPWSWPFHFEPHHFRMEILSTSATTRCNTVRLREPGLHAAAKVSMSRHESLCADALHSAGSDTASYHPGPCTAPEHENSILSKFVPFSHLPVILTFSSLPFPLTFSQIRTTTGSHAWCCSAESPAWTTSFYFACLLRSVQSTSKMHMRSSRPTNTPLCNSLIAALRNVSSTICGTSSQPPSCSPVPPLLALLACRDATYLEAGQHSACPAASPSFPFIPLSFSVSFFPPLPFNFPFRFTLSHSLSPFP